MRTVAVVPVKSFDAAKQRLSARLGGGSRHLLAQAMFSDVLAALRRVRRVHAVLVVTEDRGIEAMLPGDPVTVLHDGRREGQSAAALIGIEHAMTEGFRRALLVPGDTPLMDPEAIDGLLDLSQANHLAVTIVPDRHRAGTNALVVSPPGAFEPRFGPGSLERHVEAARRAGLAHGVEEVESLMHDVDTAEDLAALVEALERRRGVAPRTRGALRQFDRLHLRPTAAAPPPSAAGEEAGEESAAPSGGAVWHPTREGTSADRHPAWA